MGTHPARPLRHVVLISRGGKACLVSERLTLSVSIKGRQLSLPLAFKDAAVVVVGVNDVTAMIGT